MASVRLLPWKTVSDTQLQMLMNVVCCLMKMICVVLLWLLTAVDASHPRLSSGAKDACQRHGSAVPAAS